MKYSEAQAEFSIRLYRWAKVAQEKEIQDSFPSFQLCSKDGPLKSCRFFQSLDQQQQTDLAQALLHQRHEKAVTTLGEVLSDRSKEMLRRFEDFSLRTDPADWNQIPAVEIDGKQTKLAKRGQIKREIAAQFHAAFGNQCLPEDVLDRKNDGPQFGIKCRGWTIQTSFEFGRWKPEIYQAHNIWNGKWITNDQPAVLLGNSLEIGLSYGSVIGIGSSWSYLTEEDVKPACAAVIEHCKRMFEAFPELLKGLDLELLTP